MADIASLQFSVQFTSVEEATRALRDLENQGKKIPPLLDKFNNATKNNAMSFKNFFGALSQTSPQFASLASRVSSTSSLLSSFGFTASATAIGVGAITAALAKGVTAWASYERQILRVQSLLKVSGGASGQTVGSIGVLAQQIDDTSFSTKAQVRSAAAMLLQFQNIRDETFTRTLKISSDLAEVMGTDLTSAAWTLGRALEQPAEGYAQLSRAGIRFSEAEKQILESVHDSESGFAAQELILSKLESRMKGVAETAHSGLAGAWDDLGDAFSDFFLEVGKNQELISAVDTGIRMLTTLIGTAKDAVEGFTLAFEKLGGAMSVVKNVIESIPMIGSIAKGVGWVAGNYTKPFEMPFEATGASWGEILKNKQQPSASFNKSANTISSENKMQEIQFEITGLQSLISARKQSEAAYDALKMKIEAEKEARQATNNVMGAEYEKTYNLILQKKNLEKELERIGEAYQTLKEFMDGVGDALGSAFESAIFEGKSLSDVLKSLAQDIAKLAFHAAFKNVFGGASGGGGIFGFLGGLFGSAQGNVFSRGNLIPFASGGVISSPTLFPMANGAGLMGEAGAEAIMPLKRSRNGSLGVVASGSGGTVNNVTVNVQGGSSGDSMKDREFANMIGSSVIKAMIDERILHNQRGGGLLNPV